MSPQKISRRWCFTIFNYSPQDELTIAEFPACVYIVYGREVGVEETPHLQGFLIREKATAFTALKKLHAGAHWEVAKGTSQQASDYCKKGSQSHAEWASDGTEGPNYGKDASVFETGTFPASQGKRSDLKRAIDDISDGHDIASVAKRNPEAFVKFSRGLRDYALLTQDQYSHPTVRGLWIWSTGTGTGKSTCVRDKYPDLFLKSQSNWWDGYQGQKAVLLDDFVIPGDCVRETKAWERRFKAWADSFHCTGETKGGTVNLQHHVFAVTANYPPEHFFTEESALQPILRRFKVLEKTSLDVSIDDAAFQPLENPNPGYARGFNPAD